MTGRRESDSGLNCAEKGKQARRSSDLSLDRIVVLRSRMTRECPGHRKRNKRFDREYQVDSPLRKKGGDPQRCLGIKQTFLVMGTSVWRERELAQRSFCRVLDYPACLGRIVSAFTPRREDVP